METLKTLFKSPNIYRIIMAAGLVLAVILVMVIPAQMNGASPWAYYYAVKNFADGKLVLTNSQMLQEIRQAQQQGGVLMQYVRLGPDRWAVEKAPGYIFYLVPFKWLHMVRWGNILLALGMVFVTYILLKRIRNEKTACIGSLLLLFAPIGLIMWNRAYMDTFASLAFAVMGGGLYFYYFLERGKMRPWTGGLLFFLAWLLLSWSVVVRETNLLIALVFALHYIIVRITALCRRDRGWLKSELPAVVLGVGIPLAVLLIYNNAVFGSPFDYGYKHTVFPVKFAYDYLGQVNAAGQSMPWKIITDNLRLVPPALLQGFPVLVVGFGALIIVLWQRFSRKPGGSWAGLSAELPWGTLLVLAGWFLSVYALYMTYEFTAEYLKAGTSYFRFARYYLPALFPVAMVSALVLGRLPLKFSVPLVAGIMAAGIVLYYQVALNPVA